MKPKTVFIPMKNIYLWFQRVVLKHAFENPKTFEKNLYKIFLPLILGIPLFTLYNNFPETAPVSQKFHPDRMDWKDSVSPIPEILTLKESYVLLGDFLFHSKTLSEGENFSCSTCHSLDQGGTVSSKNPNPPTVFNAALPYYLSGINQKKSSSQPTEPVHFPEEMGDISKNFPKLKEELKVSLPLGSFQKNLSMSLVSLALREYLFSLTTPNSRFDKFLSGDKKSLSSEEQEGYTLFREYGCSTCHQGVNLGGNLYHLPASSINESNDSNTGGVPGTYLKVPGLRNIAVTGPYYRDGSYDTLSAAIRGMAETYVGYKISDSDTKKIHLFLESLTGEYKGKILK